MYKNRCGFRLRVVGTNWAVFTTVYHGSLWYLAGGQMAPTIDSLKLALRHAYGKRVA